jgi:hypothetical protein
MHTLLLVRRGATIGVAALAFSGCNTDVSNPSVVDASTIDPVADARVFSLSAQQDFYVAYAGQGSQSGNYINISAAYSNETWMGVARNETTDIARHAIVDTNLDLNSQFWVPLQTAIGTNDQVLSVLKGTPTFNTDIAVARASVWSGFAVELLGESFCQGVLHVGPALTPAQMLDSAIARFQQGIAVAGAITGSAEATKLLNAARVGLARAYLQKGDNANALATANLVPPTFVATTVHVDDPQARSRVGNGVFLTSSGTGQTVATPYRLLGDPRVTFVDANANTQTGGLRLFRQTKYTSVTTPVRIASGLEARYIAAEAQLKINGTTAPALALIAERRTAGNQPAFTGTTTAAVLAELMDQRARDFWLEGKHLGDVIRNPTAAALVPAANSPFYRPEFGTFQPLVCLPVPFAEKSNNPNF